MTIDALDRKPAAHFKKLNGRIAQDELEAMREEWREEGHELEEVRKEQDEERNAYRREIGSVGEPEDEE